MALPAPTNFKVTAHTATTADLQWTPFKNDGSSATVILNDDWDDVGYDVGDDYPCMEKGAAYSNHWRRSYQSDSVDGTTKNTSPDTEPPWRTRPVFSDDYPGRLSPKSLKVEMEHGDPDLGWRTRRKEMILLNGDTGGLPNTLVFKLEPGETYAWSYSVLLVDNGDFDQFGADGSVMLQTHSSVDAIESGISPVVMFGVQSNKYPRWYGKYATKAMHGAAAEDVYLIDYFNGADEDPQQEITDIGVGWTYGSYVDVVTIIKPDPIGAGGPWPADGVAPYTGRFEIWLNGVKKVDYSGPMNTNDEGHNYGPIIGNYFANHNGVVDADHGQPHLNYIGHFMLARGAGVTFADVAPNGDITNYGLQLSEDGGEWADVPANQLSTPLVASAEEVQVTGLTDGSKYKFRIKSISSPDVSNEDSAWVETAGMAPFLDNESNTPSTEGATIRCDSDTAEGTLYYCSQELPIPGATEQEQADYIIANATGSINPVSIGENEAIVTGGNIATPYNVGWVQLIPDEPVAPFQGDFYTSPGPFTFTRGGEQTGEAIV